MRLSFRQQSMHDSARTATAILYVDAVLCLCLHSINFDSGHGRRTASLASLKFLRRTALGTVSTVHTLTAVFDPAFCTPCNAKMGRQQDPSRHRVFPIAGAKVWNSLSDDVTSAPSLSTFRRQ